eukprot:139626-Pelagomonas_calceolata.AAC.1
MSSAWRWVLIRIGFRVFLEIWERQDALSEAMSVCPCWSATRMPANSALLMVFLQMLGGWTSVPSRCLMLGVGGYAVAWQDWDDPGVASDLLEHLGWG